MEAERKMTVRARIDLGGVDAIDAIDMLEELKCFGFRLLRRNGPTLTYEADIDRGDFEWCEGALKSMEDEVGGPWLRRFSVVV